LERKEISLVVDGVGGVERGRSFGRYVVGRFEGGGLGRAMLLGGRGDVLVTGKFRLKALELKVCLLKRSEKKDFETGEWRVAIAPRGVRVWLAGVLD
jgi:hypothetical protein